MKPDADRIADAFLASLDDTGPIEKTVYYRVQKDCLDAARDSEPLASNAFRIIAHLAEGLARELEDDAIAADSALLWKRYPLELEAAIRLVGQDLTSEHTQRQLEQRFSILSSVRGRP